MKTPFPTEVTKVDFCVVGGGLAGMLAAISAARAGAKVALMQDRPVLGGNASSEMRMWVCGAHGKNMHETGIIEDLMLENCYRNPTRNPSIWDSVLYGAVKFNPRIQVILNCSCCDVEMDGKRIVSVTGWQTTTQKWQKIEAKLFADCSGDSVLAPLTGADFRVGREARAEFGEDIEPEKADNHTMGMSCLIQARETDKPCTFIPPPWANVYASDEEITRPMKQFSSAENYWWMELGGMVDSIRDTEVCRDELVKVAFGVWDYIKNHGDHGAENWQLDWVGFLPGKRESRRYLGDLIMTQNDVRAEGRFDDIVAYGGWTMDDHNPMGFHTREKPTIFHPAPSPYGISYRSLYSRNIDNLLFAGRNISVSHAALSSTRVMSTCAIIGQAAGTAAGIAIREGIDPRGVSQHFTHELQQTLLRDDCYLPWVLRDIPALSRDAKLSASEGDPAKLRNGVDRPVGEETNDHVIHTGGWVEYDFGKEAPVAEARIVFDSDLNRTGGSCNYNLLSNVALNQPALEMPAPLVRDFRVEVAGDDGAWKTVATVKENKSRLARIKLEGTARKVRLVPEATWGGGDEVRLFAFDIR